MNAENLNQVNQTTIIIEKYKLTDSEWKDCGKGKLIQLGRQLFFKNKEGDNDFEVLFRNPDEETNNFFNRVERIRIEHLREGFKCKENWIGKVIEISDDLKKLTLAQAGEMDILILGIPIEKFKRNEEVNILGKVSKVGYIQFLIEPKE